MLELATAALLFAGNAPLRVCDMQHETRGIIGGRAVCLGVGEPCRSRYQRQYRRYGFRCRDGSLDYDWAALHRPLRVPRISPGAPCPASPRRGQVHPAVSVNIASPFGPGPAYPTLRNEAGHASLVMVWQPSERPYIGWAGTKVLWTAPLYTGAALIRGRQLDGPGRLGLDVGPGWTNRVQPEIKLIAPEDGLRPAATFVRTPGCYAYQVDTLRRSYRIVFEVLFGF